jgi:hypothetical protein
MVSILLTKGVMTCPSVQLYVCAIYSISSSSFSLSHSLIFFPGWRSFQVIVLSLRAGSIFVFMLSLFRLSPIYTRSFVCCVCDLIGVVWSRGVDIQSGGERSSQPSTVISLPLNRILMRRDTATGGVHPFSV